MSTNTRKPPGSFHKIREFELEKIHLSDEFDILQIVGEGWFGKILLVEHRATDTEMVLKALPKPYVSLRDFYREFHYGLHLGLHKNIVTTYDVAFETAGFYVFTQEYAPLGDLTSNVSESGIGDLHSKRVAKQIASALDYMHSKEIVHRDVKLDNVLIYKSDFSRVKLCDFGESYKAGTIVERRNEWLPYSPPEVLHIKPEDTYKADRSHDIWQFAIVLFVCLTGCLPWQKASSDDPRYARYLAWQTTNMVLPLRRTPKLFKLLSSKGSRMFRKFLEPKPERRPKNLSDLSKFIDDRWLAKGAEKDLAENEQDVLCASMYSFHSSPEEKNKLLTTLAEYGIETTVDRVAKKNRIKDWIESSVITEEDEEDDSGTATIASSVSREPVAGHISSVRAQEEKKIHTTIKDASNKHFDPRTGVLQDGPSEMGAVNHNQNVGNIMNGKNGSFDNGSVITLASRNDLILSEGQSFHSELNLSMIQEKTAEPMVNARLNLSLKNNNNNNNDNNHTNINHNESISNVANCNLSNNNNILTNSMQPKKNISMPLYQSYSVSSLNVNNNYVNGNLKSINNQYNATYNRLLNNFQSAANISAATEVKQQQQQQFYSSTQIKDSGYGSYDKIKLIGKSELMVSSPVLSKRTDFKEQLSSTNSLTKDKSILIGRKNDELQNPERRNATMKDTPYDRIKVKKN